jgi:4-amino-4-deoxy-L-arabinose transferase-like glycosyltransferase
MQTVPHVLGVAHPTGYPTYILLAWVFEMLPIGSVAFRANLLSALLVAGTLALAVAILLRLRVRPVIALGTAVALGAVGTVWSSATVAEVDPLHLFLMAALILLALRWADERRPRDLLLGGLLIGLAIGNHLLTIFVAPFLVIFAVWAGRSVLRERPWILAATAGLAILGLAVYLYIPWAASRNPPLAYNHPVTLDSVLWLVTGEQFRYQFDLLSPRGPGEFVAHLPTLARTAAAEATIVLPIVGIVGLPFLARRRPAFGWTVIAMLITGGFVWATYQRLEHYLLVPFLLTAISAGVALDATANGLAALVRRTRWRDDPRLNGIAGLIVGLGAIVFAIALAGVNWNASDRSDDHGGDRYVAELFGALPPNAMIVSYWDPTGPLWYGQHVEGLRPDVQIVDDSNAAYDGRGDALAWIARAICERPVFIMRITDQDVQEIRSHYPLTKFLTVRSSALGPTAVLNQDVYRVEPPSSCGAAGAP